MNWTRMLLMWFLLIPTVKRGGWPCAAEVSLIVYMFLYLPHCTLDIFATVKCVDHGREYGLEIPGSFHFYEPEKAIKLAEKRNSTDRRKFN